MLMPVPSSNARRRHGSISHYQGEQIRNAHHAADAAFSGDFIDFQ
jgi:hypothetical protein